MINNITIIPVTILNVSDNKIIQPEHINIELFEHQKTMIYKLCEREEEKKIIIHNFDNKNKIEIIDVDTSNAKETITIKNPLEQYNNIVEKIKYFSFEAKEAYLIAKELKQQFNIEEELPIL